MTLQERSEITEARLLLRWAASNLTETERLAVTSWLAEETLVEACIGSGVTRGGIWMARQSAIRKMRERLEILGIRSSLDVCSRVC